MDDRATGAEHETGAIVGRRRRMACAGLVLALLSVVPAVQAWAQAYPNKPIRLVVPFPPGGANDIVARVISPKLSEALGQPVVVENRGGAAGTIGSDLVAKAAPDGYTLLMTPVPFVITQSLYAKLPYDGQRDFVPIALLTSSPFVLAVGEKYPSRTLQDLVLAAKAKPDSVAFSSPGSGSPAHLAGELLKVKTGAPFLHVPYKGGGPAVTDMIAGHVAFTLATPAELMQHVREGKARALAVTTPKRTSLAPDVPTAAEAGVAGFEITVWYGITAPRGTPAPIVGRLERELMTVLKAPEVRDRLTALGLEVTPMGSEEFGRFLRTEHEKWSELVRVSGAKPD